MKPLSEKNIQKMYLKAGISEDESVLLHKYLSCFSNLYGCIQIDVLWDVFKQYKEKITKTKFFDFVDICQREVNDYLILNLNEAYGMETSEETKDKLLVNKWLIKRYENKFWYLHNLEEYKDTRFGPYVSSKKELFTFENIVFYEQDCWKEMVNFVSNLKTSGFRWYEYVDKKVPLNDIYGKSIKGKCLKDIICLTVIEEVNIERCKQGNQKEYLIAESNKTCAEKVLEIIKECVYVYDPLDVNRSIKRIFDFLSHDFGTDIEMDEANEFLRIYSELSNSANRWSMFGYSPNIIRSNIPASNGPVQLEIGPNMQKMIEEGELDLKELENLARQNNMDINFTDNESEDIVKENGKHLELFKEYLFKRNFKDNVIYCNLDRADYYINDYLVRGLPRYMEDGCSIDEVINFIESNVNRDIIPPNVNNIDLYITSIYLFYECMCEHGFVPKVELKMLKNDIHDFKDEMIEDFYDKNPKEIDLFDVVEAIEFAYRYGTAYINVKTGEVKYIPEDEELYDGDINELYDTLENPNWEKIPEVDDHKIMLDFAESLNNRNQSKKLCKILQGKKAYWNFKDAIFAMRIEEDFFNFYASRIEQLAQEWLEDNGIDTDFDDPVYN